MIKFDCFSRIMRRKSVLGSVVESDMCRIKCMNYWALFHLAEHAHFFLSCNSRPSNCQYGCLFSHVPGSNEYRYILCEEPSCNRFSNIRKQALNINLLLAMTAATVAFHFILTIFIHEILSANFKQSSMSTTVLNQFHQNNVLPDRSHFALEFYVRARISRKSCCCCDG